jgi:hypothetical protein
MPAEGGDGTHAFLQKLGPYIDFILGEARCYTSIYFVVVHRPAADKTRRRRSVLSGAEAHEPEAAGWWHSCVIRRQAPNNGE